MNNSKKKTKTKRKTKSKSKHTKSKHTKSKYTKSKHTKKSNKRGIEKYCNFYKNDINGKINKQLYRSCKINKYCRKYKCKSIDDKMSKQQLNKLGHNYNKLVLDSLHSACPISLEDNNNKDNKDNKNNKNRKKCESKALKKFYKENSMDEIYSKVVECDKKTCSKEKQIFNTNLFRQKQLKLKKKQRDIIDTEHFMEEADVEMIEKN